MTLKSHRAEDPRPRRAAILVSLLFAVLAIIAAVGFYIDPRDDGELHWPFTLGWVAWALMFAVLEYVAVKRNPEGKGGGGDTLSEHVWKLLRHPILRLMAVGAWVWITIHFFTPYL